MQPADDHWAEGTAYNLFMGRWSSLAARGFLQWLAPAPHLHWLDIGCGTGALSEAVIQLADPDSVTGCDPSASFVEEAGAKIPDPRASFLVATLEDLPQRASGYDAIVSGLVLNFTADPVGAIRLMMQRGNPGSLVAAYVWDYAGRMDFLRTFWDEATALDPAAARLDEGRRFPLCQPNRLADTFGAGGLNKVSTAAIDIPTIFNSFGDYWEPFLAGTGPAPSYVSSLKPGQRDRLAAALERRLVPVGGGKIKMLARAWAVRGEFV